MGEYTTQEQVHNLRKAIDELIVHTAKMKTEAEPNKGIREFSLVYTKLQEAKMWAGKVLEEMGSELPKEFQDKAE